MGVIITGMRSIKPAYDQILNMVEEVATSELQRDMEFFVNDCFSALKPLAHQYKVVCNIDDDKLCIGEWLRIKRWHDVYGYNIERGGFFTTIRTYGDALKFYVRRVIKEDFDSLVYFTKQLIPYEDILIEINIPEIEIFEYQITSSIKITPFIINKIGIKTCHPSHIILFKKDGEQEDKYIFSESNLSLFEDIINYMVDLYKEASNKVSVIKRHNEEIMKQMSIISEPWKITNRLKG